MSRFVVIQLYFNISKLATNYIGFVGIMYASQLTGVMRESPKLAREHSGISKSIVSIEDRNKFLKTGTICIYIV